MQTRFDSRPTCETIFSIEANSQNAINDGAMALLVKRPYCSR